MHIGLPFLVLLILVSLVGIIWVSILLRSGTKTTSAYVGLVLLVIFLCALLVALFMQITTRSSDAQVRTRSSPIYSVQHLWHLEGLDASDQIGQKKKEIVSILSQIENNLSKINSTRKVGTMLSNKKTSPSAKRTVHKLTTNTIAKLNQERTRLLSQLEEHLHDLDEMKKMTRTG